MNAGSVWVCIKELRWETGDRNDGRWSRKGDGESVCKTKLA